MVRFNNDFPRFSLVYGLHNPAALQPPCPHQARGFEHQPQICLRKPAIQHAFQDVPAQLQFKTPPFGTILHGCRSITAASWLLASNVMIQLTITDVINADDRDSGLSWGSGTPPNKSPRRKPGDREPPDADPVAYAPGFYSAGESRSAQSFGGMPLPSLRLESCVWSVASISKPTVRTMPSA